MRRHSVTRIVGTTLVGLLAFGVGGAGYAYWDIQGNITGLNIDDLVGDDPTIHQANSAAPTPTYADPLAGSAMNILLMGSDDRSGENAEIGGEDEGMRSDTTLLMHISADRTRVEAVSIPRDLLTAIPSCELPSGSQTKAQSEAMFNSAFSLGAQQSETGSDEAKAYGAACTIRTVQAMTGITIDEFALVDFAGFQKMVDAIGGVTMTFSEDLKDDYTGLDITAGEHTLNGVQALQLARARHIAGTDGSDIGRIDRQQELLSAMVAEILETNLLTNGPDLYRFISAATESLTTSQGLSQITSLVGLGMSLKGVSLDSVHFSTVPFVYAGPRVRATAEADVVWQLLASDQPLPVEVEETPVGAGTPSEGASTEG